MLGELNKEEIEELLNTQLIGRIGCHADGVTYIVPVNFVYENPYIYAHSAKGLKIDNMRKNPEVCFEVDEMKDMTNWKSVIVWGHYDELKNERDRYNAMKLFVDKLMHMKISETAVLPETTEKRIHPRSPGNIKPIIYRIIINEKTGRFEK